MKTALNVRIGCGPQKGPHPIRRSDRLLDQKPAHWPEVVPETTLSMPSESPI
jgi:hypothetical protein